MKSLYLKLQSWFTNSSGATSIEFSVVSLPLIYMVFATIEVGYKSILQSELDSKLYATAANLSINMNVAESAQEYLNTTFCPVIGTTLLNCNDIQISALVTEDRMRTMARETIAGTWSIGCENNAILIELLYPISNLLIPFAVADVVDINNQKYYRSRGVTRREPMLEGEGEC